MGQNEVEYKVRIARNKQGKNGEAIRIKFGDAVLHRTGIPTYDRCFVGIRDGKIFFKFFNGLPNIISKFDDSKMFRIQSLGNMPGITITSKRFLDYFAGFEGEYDEVGWLVDELHVFVINPINRHNFTNLYKNTSTTVTQKEEEKTICHYPEVKQDDSYLDADQPKELKSKLDIMVIREEYVDMWMQLYYKALEKKDQDNIGYFKFKLLSCSEWTQLDQFRADAELAVKGVIACGGRDYAEMLLKGIAEIFELTRDYN